MEIQSLVLCKELSRSGKGNSYDGKMIGLHSFYSTDGNFPLRFEMPYYMLLRREQRDGDETVTLRFNLELNRPRMLLLQTLFYKAFFKKLLSSDSAKAAFLGKCRNHHCRCQHDDGPRHK